MVWLSLILAACGRAPEATPPLDPPSNNALFVRGDSLFAAGQYETASEYFHRVRERLAETEGQGLGLAHRRLGDCSVVAGDIAEARTHYLKAIECFQQSVDTTFEAKARIVLGLLEYNTGNQGSAHPHFQNAVVLFRLSNDQPGLVSALSLLAETALDAGRQDSALVWARESVALAESLGVPALEVQAIESLATIRRRFGDMDRARALLHRAQSLAESAGDPELQAGSVAGEALLEIDLGNHVRARTVLLRAADLFAEAGNQIAEQETRVLASRLAQDGDSDPGPAQALSD